MLEMSIGRTIEIFDSTLRDGTQGEGISFTTGDKLAILKALDDISISYIEGGNPASNPRDMDFFEQAAGVKLKHAELVAFGATRHSGHTALDDIGLKALLHSGAGVLCIFGKASLLHVEQVLNVSPQENLAMISDTVSFLKEKGKRVFFDAEHFFDGCKFDFNYAIECLKAAFYAGAERIILCDTNGGSFPDEIFETVTAVKKALPEANLGIHCHNDNGCGVACSIMAVKAGASQVQGTYLGFGERCGNASLSALIPSLQLKLGYSCIKESCMEKLTETARFIADIANMTLPNSAPYVGGSAFAHKGGMHVDGVNKNPNSFEHISPKQVGNHRTVLLSDMSGRSALMSVLKEIDPSIERGSNCVADMVELLKRLEYEGYVFESAAASLNLRLRKELNRFSPYFKLKSFKVIGESAQPQSSETQSVQPRSVQPRAAGVGEASSKSISRAGAATAVIKLEVNGQTEVTAAEGEGPVHALDLALKRAVQRFYPTVCTMKLIDYKVRVIEPSDATAAMVRVLITSSDGKNIWTTVGVSRDIIEASLNALTDAVEYKLLLETEQRLVAKREEKGHKN